MPCGQWQGIVLHFGREGAGAEAWDCGKLRAGSALQDRAGMPVLFLTSNGAPSQTATWTSSLRASPEEAFMVPAPLAQSLAEESWSGPCPCLANFDATWEKGRVALAEPDPKI